MDDVQAFAKGMEQAEVAYWIPMELIETDADQPRKFFDEEGMDELKGSVKENKQRLPIHVRPSPTFEQDRKFIIVSGERRWRVAKDLGETRIRAFIMLEKGIDAFNWSFIENLNRRGFTPMEEAQGLLRYLNEGLTLAQIAQKTGKSVSHVQQTLLLNELPLPLQEKVATGKLAASTGMVLVKGCDTQAEMTDTMNELTRDAPGSHGLSYKRLTANKVKAHIERRKQLREQKENGDTPGVAARKELAKCLEPAATALFGLLDEIVALGEESAANFEATWSMIPKPKRSGIEATLEAIRIRIEKTQALIASGK